MNNEIPMFAVANDTSKWAVCIDGKYQLFDSRENAYAVLDELVPDGDIEASIHGSWQILPPRYIPRLKDITPISMYEETDLRKYHADKEAALLARMEESRKREQARIDEFYEED